MNLRLAALRTFRKKTWRRSWRSPISERPRDAKMWFCSASSMTRERTFTSLSIFQLETCVWIHPRKCPFWASPEAAGSKHRDD